MSGSTAPPLYNLPFGPASSSTIMNNHLEPSYSTYGAGDSTYLNSLQSSSSHYTNMPAFPTASSSSHAGPSSQGPAGESTPGSSKRPFPWASGSGSQERDKRARSCDGSSGFIVSGNAGASGSGQGTADNEEDGEDSMSTDESAYASAAESPQFNPSFSRSPTRVDTPRSRPLAPVEEYQDTHSSFGPAHNPTSHATYTYPDPIPSSVPRIPTPAALRSSSPLGLLDDSSNTGPAASGPARSRPSPRPLPAARPTRIPSLSLHALAEPRGLPQYDISQDGNRNDIAASHQSNTQELVRNTPGGLDLGWLTQQLDEALPPPRSLEPFSSTTSDPSASASSLFPTHPTREFSTSFGSGSVDSALPLSNNRNGPGRVPLPWVDIEHEGEGDELLRSVSGSALSGDITRPTSPGLGGSTSSGFGDGTSSTGNPADSTSSPDFVLSPELGQSVASIDARLASPTFAGLSSSSSPQGVESVASTVRSDNSPPATAWTGHNSDTHTEIVPNEGHSASATFGSPSTSGSSPSTRTTARRPLSLNLRGFPTSPTLSLSGSRSFIESPTFPTSVSPRTSAFDLAVTPPGSALPSFVARMMEVDSPVREVAGGDRTSHAYTLSDITLGSQAENNTASIDALRRFVQGNEDQALADVAVESYFPESPRQEDVQFAIPPGSAANQGEAVGATNEHIPQPSLDNSDETQRTDHQPESSWSSRPSDLEAGSRPSDLDSIYSRRLTESGVSYPSRPSDSGASLPSFRAAVSPGPELNMGSRPGRVVRDMSWSFSDLFRPHEGLEETPSGSGSEASLLTRVGGEDTNDRGSGNDREIRGSGRGRASVRNALSRAVGLANSVRTEGPPRLHLNALPRMSGPGLDQQDERRSATNLSRTPPVPGPTPNAVPSSAENWFEESSSTQARPVQPPPPRRMSATRWTDLLPEAAAQPVSVPMTINPPMRLRMPPVAPAPATDSAFDSLSGMSWNRGSHTASVPYIDSSSANTQVPQDSAAAALARYQTFAQSIEEIRRSPSQSFPAQLSNTTQLGNTAQLGNTTTQLGNTTTQLGNSAGQLGNITAPTVPNAPPARPFGGVSNINETSARPPWALPRRAPPPPFNHQRPRNPYALTPDNNQPPPAPTRSNYESESFGSAPDGNWLREWETQRDRRSRAAREGYFRRRDTVSSSNSTLNVTEVGPSDPPRRHPMTQLSDTQAQGQMWGGFDARHRPRPRPMTRASLVGTGFADDDLTNEWSNNSNVDNAPRRWGEPFRPPRRPEILPPRADDADSPMRFSSNAEEDGMGGMLFTESPPSMLADLQHDSTTGNPYMLSNPEGPQPFPRANAPDFRTASHALRLSLDTSRRDSASPSHAESLNGSLGRRSLVLSDPPMRFMPDQSDRSRLPVSRDRRESSSRAHLDRVRQFLHSRSSESRDREPSRRHPADIGQPSPTQTRRRSFLSVLDTEPSSPAFSESTGSLRRLSMPWSRNEPTSAIDTHSAQPFPPHENEHPEWPSTESPSRSGLTHELLRTSSIRRRRRTLLSESSSRRDSHGFLNSMNSALHQVESGLLHINRELNALADETNESLRRFGPQTETETRHEISSSSSSRMDWAFDQIERNPSPPPRLPPFNFSNLQQNSDWPASRRNQYSGPENPPHDPQPEGANNRRTPTRGLDGYFESRQNSRDSVAQGFRAYEYSWRNDGSTNELWSNEVAPSPATSMPLRDRLLFRTSATAHPPMGSSSRQPERNTGMGPSISMQQPPTQPGRLHRRRPSPPAPPTPSSTGSLLRPFLNQTPTSPARSYTSRLSHLLPRRSSGRGGGAGSGDDNEDWHHAHPPEPTSSRRFFIRARGRSIRGPPLPNGDFMRDEEFDDSYEGLLRLAARIGDVKPRGTPAEVIRSMPSCNYANATGAKAETRCPICLDDYAQEDTVSMIKQCSHWFHRECIQQWLSNSRTCPVCRGQADGEGDSESQAGPSSSAPENSWV